MVIVDNASVDGTRDIIQKCQREGPPYRITLLDEPDFSYRQSERMTALFHKVQAAFRADVILLLDADEFIACHSRIDFEQRALWQIPSHGVGFLGWETCVISGLDSPPGFDVPRTISWKRKQVDKGLPFRKAVIRADGDPMEGLVIAQGNHYCTWPARLEMSYELPIPLLHFPVRSFDQFVSKVVVGWMAVMTRDPEALRKQDALQWGLAFQKIIDGGVSTSEESFRYTQRSPHEPIDWKRDIEPVGFEFDYERKYSSGAYDGALAMIAKSWERSVKHGR